MLHGGKSYIDKMTIFKPYLNQQFNKYSFTDEH